MAELKNKDGVPIIVGQVWASTGGFDNTILHIEYDYIMFRECGCMPRLAHHESPDGIKMLHRLISCPVLGDMSEYDIVTAEQKRDYDNPICAESFTQSGWVKWDNSHWRDLPCRVPRGFNWEPYRKGLEGRIRCFACQEPAADDGIFCEFHADGNELADRLEIPRLSTRISGYEDNMVELQAWAERVTDAINTLTDNEYQRIVQKEDDAQ